MRYIEQNTNTFSTAGSTKDSRVEHTVTLYYIAAYDVLQGLVL